MSRAESLTFTAIDFETANSNRDSVCSVGLAVVDSGTVVLRHEWLVCPPEPIFTERFMELHGITLSQVCDKPTFAVIWPDLQKIITGPLVAHNAGFDMGVLQASLDTWGLPIPDLDYFCSLELARSQWPRLHSHSLGALAEYLGLALNHHRAGDDAFAAAMLVITAAKQWNLTSLTALLEAHGIQMGHICPDTCGPPPRRASPVKNRVYLGPSVKPQDLTPKTTVFDEGHPFHDKLVVFTGTLQTMARVDAWQAIVDVGGACSTSLSRKVDYLVAGDQDPQLLNGNDQSIKMRRAQELCAKGHPINIITESDFLRLLGR